MAAQKGLDVAINISSDGTSGGTMNEAAGMRTRTLSFSTDTVDVTTADDTSRWRQLLTGAAIKTASISGDGVFKDSTPDADLQDHFFQGTAAYLEFVVPDFGTAAGLFIITSLEFGSNHDAEVTFSASFESAGDITWTAA